MGLGLRETTFANARQIASGESWMQKRIDSRQAFIKERIDWAVTQLRARNELISIASVSRMSKLRWETVRRSLNTEQFK